MTIKIIFPILMTLFVVVIILCKEFNVTIKSLTANQKNMLFLAEPFVYSLYCFSWMAFTDYNIYIKLIISVIIGIIIFIGISAYYLPPKQGSKAFSPEELLNMCVLIKYESDRESHYLGELIGEGVDIVIKCDEKLKKNDIAQISEIKGSDIIAKKINM